MDTNDDQTRLSADVTLEGDKLDAVEQAGRGPVVRAAGATDAKDVEPELEDALEYLLSAFTDPDSVVVTRVLRVNVGAPNKPRILRWTIRNIPGPMIRKIREDAEEQARRTKGSSGAQAGFDGNVRIVIEGTVDPDVKAGAVSLGVMDSGAFLETALQGKQGLIEQIAGAILTLSGYDDEDVNDELEARAAGNS